MVNLDMNKKSIKNSFAWLNLLIRAIPFVSGVMIYAADDVRKSGKMREISGA